MEHRAQREDLHPVNHLVVGKLEDEFIDDTIYSHGSTDELEFGVCGVVEDEIVLVKVGELGAAYTASQLIQVISFLSQL